MPVSDFGRIGRDAELRYTASGDPVCNVPVAVEHGRKGQDGKRQTQWYEVTLWGKQAEGLAPYLLKGKQVFFTATELHVEEFKKSDGSHGVKLACRCSEIKFASDGQAQAGAHPQAQAARQPAPRTQQQSRPQQQQPAPDGSFDDADIPFADPYRGTRCLLT